MKTASVPILGTAVAAGLGGLTYLEIVRPWYLRWGATEEEVNRPMPLDDRIPEPMLNSTMAITIHATPGEVWQWLVQMGDPPRAGYYSYTWIERMVGLQIMNADVILPEFQTVHTGDALDKGGTMVVQHVDPERYLVLGPPESVEVVKCTWAFGLYPIDERSTRLVTRVRAVWSYSQMLKEMSPLAWPLWLAIEPGAFVMERKMLREIKRNAEETRSQARRYAT
jgi:hypothetical protein